MRILYYDWAEFNGEDARDAMGRLGWRVDVLRVRLSDGGMDVHACERMQEMMKRAEEGGGRYDAVFSFDFFPEVSEVCLEMGVPYSSWVFDCPHYPLYSEKLANAVNRVHIFDRALYEDLKGKGYGATVFHTPLAVNADRLKEVCNSEGALSEDGVPKNPVPGLQSSGRSQGTFFHDVAFVGNLYDNEFNFYDQAGFPDGIRAYLGDVFDAQQRIFGADILGDERVIPDDLMQQLHAFLNFENTGRFRINYDKVILDILRKKVTILERRKILEELGRRFDTAIYTTSDAKEIPGVRNMGFADYMGTMPRVFNRSRININITMRCITSGISLRVLDVLGAGGFLLTSSNPEIEERFTDGVDLSIARTPEEMIEKTAYYLEHEDERKEIAKNGQRKVFEEFSYGRLLQRMIQ